MTKAHIPPNWKQANMVTYIFQAPEDTDPIMYMVDNKVAKESLDADTIKQLYDSMGARGLTHIELDILAQVPTFLEGYKSLNNMALNQIIRVGLLNNRITNLKYFVVGLTFVGTMLYIGEKIFG